MTYQKPVILEESSFRLSLYGPSQGCTTGEFECDGPGEQPV